MTRATCSSSSEVICGHCHYSTLQRPLKEGDPVWIRDQYGLFCSKCNSFSCRKCLSNIYTNGVNPSLRVNDTWCQSVELYLSQPADSVVPAFVGSCCQFKEHPMYKAVQEPLSGVKFDGHLYLPEFNLLIDSPLDGVIDVHGLGPSAASSLPGVWHCVLSHECAEGLYRLDITPDGSAATWGAEQIFKLDVPLPHSPNNTKRFKIRHRTILQSAVFNRRDQATNDPLPSTIAKCAVISRKDNPAGVHIDIISAVFYHKSGSREHSLALFRLYPPSGYKAISPQATQKLYQQVLDLCTYEKRRQGGSSGLTALDWHFFHLLRSKGAFPRRASSVKFTDAGDSWRFSYISRKQYKATNCFYTPPKLGGQFDMSQKLFQTNQVFSDFAEAKILAATVLLTMHQTKGISIQQRAVENELSNLSFAIRMLSAPTCSLPYPAKKVRKKVLSVFACHNRHTLVTHPVGAHQDHFDKNTECLENKMCFVIPGQQEGVMGRGGAGKGKFVAAILDWNSDRRELLQTFRALGGTGVLTQSKQMEFFTLNEEAALEFPAEALMALHQNGDFPL